MVEFEIQTSVNVKNSRHVYLYGKFYGSIFPNGASDSIIDYREIPEETKQIIIYSYTKDEPRTIGSLEGIFICDCDPNENGNARRNHVLGRYQMEDFENKYKGQFIPFDGE
jgi:hypothetical protein